VRLLRLSIRVGTHEEREHSLVAALQMPLQNERQPAKRVVHPERTGSHSLRHQEDETLFC